MGHTKTVKEISDKFREDNTKLDKEFAKYAPFALMFVGVVCYLLIKFVI